MKRWQQVTVIVCAVIFVAAIVLTIQTAFIARQSQGKLRGVGEAGPCRAHGIFDAECKRQARLIAAACLADLKCRRIVMGFNQKGVVASSGSNPSGQPSPGSPGPPANPPPSDPLAPVKKLLPDHPKVCVGNTCL